MNAIIIDTETTDKDPETCEVCEVAWREFDLAKPWELQGGARFGIKNGMKWGALAAHHILPSELENTPTFGESAFWSTMPDVQYWIGHNIDFDWIALGSPSVKRICTLAMCRELWPEADSHTLSAMMYFTQGANAETRAKLRSAHSAIADVDMCGEILSTIIKVAAIDSLVELYAYSEEARIPKKMSFGKFLGQPIENVDRGYANWYRKTDKPDPYLLQAFRRHRLL